MADKEIEHKSGENTFWRRSLRNIMDLGKKINQKMTNFIKKFAHDATHRFGSVGFWIVLLFILFNIGWRTTIIKWLLTLGEILSIGFDNTLFFGVLSSLIIAMLCAFIIYRYGVRGKYIDTIILYISILALITWAFYRFSNNYELVALPFSSNNLITYSDFILIISCVCILSWILNIYLRYSKSDTNDSKEFPTLISDEAIVDWNQDRLQRDVFVNTIANTIMGHKPKEESYSMGIVAPWGAGKTSFINLVIEKLNSEPYSRSIKIEKFSPWLLPSAVNITERFFDQLKKWTSIEGNSSLNDLIAAYIAYITGDASNVFKFKTDKTSESEKIQKGIRDEMKETSKKYLIIIDDLDRLQGAEILDVFKIIRGSANFPNLFFLVLFDKDYVSKALKTYSEAIEEKFIEKFFQVEYYLPDYQKSILIDEAIALAKTFMTETDSEDFKKYLTNSRSYEDRMPPIETYIENMRALIRWMNIIKLEYFVLKGEVAIEDLADVALLRLFYPNIYMEFRQSSDIYLEIDRGRYYLYEKSEEGPSPKFDYRTLFSSSNKVDLKTLPIYTKLNDNEKLRLDCLLNRLFPPSHYDSLKDKSIAIVFYYRRYFYGALQDYDISEEKFVELSRMSYEKAKEKVKEYANRQAAALVRHFEKYNSVDNETTLKIVGLAIYLGHLTNGENSCNPDNLHDLIISATIEKGELKRKVMDFMLENGPSVYIVRLLDTIKSYYVRNNWQDIFSQKDMTEIAVSNFCMAAGNHDIGINDLLSMFWITTKRNSKNEVINHDERSKEAMKKRIIESPDKMLPVFIYNDCPFEELCKRSWGLSSTLSLLWDNQWPAFEADLLALDSSDIVQEFQAFYKKYKINNYQPVEFPFKYIQK